MNKSICETASSMQRPSYNQSIIKVVNDDESYESDFISDDEHINRISPTTSVNLDLITTTTTSNQCNTITINRDFDNNTSTFDLCKRSMAFSQTPCNIRKYQHFNDQSLYAPSPSVSYHTRNQLVNISLESRRSRSLTDVQFSTLGEKLTADSGTGESLRHIPSTASPQLQSYEQRNVLGQNKQILMPNPHDFDITKVQEYQNRKRRFQIPLPWKKTQPTPEQIPDNLRRNRNRNRNTNTGYTKPTSIFSHVLQVFKPKTVNQYTIQPATRHHFSYHKTDETN